MEKKPILTIGMIFKNEIRCLERCLKALRPLRDAVPCELVMADTGSTDGSREIAAKYADILFDFPWVNDFSAARNAVMDRASGKWFLTVDADEYLDPDVSELAEFLLRGSSHYEAGTVIQRNYFDREMNDGYSDFTALRLLKISTGLRYHGAIHESWAPEEGKSAQVLLAALSDTVLHHDGYVDLSGEGGRAKRERNLQLLRQELKKYPKDLRRLQQYIESGMREEDYLETIRYAAKLVEEKSPGWEVHGPPIFRLAVAAAVQQELPEAEAWIQRAVDWFPDSYFTRIDVAALAFVVYWNRKEDYAACIRWGEMYFEGCEEHDRDREKRFALLCGAVAKSSPMDQSKMRVFLSSAYLMERQPEKALAALERVEFTLLTPDTVVFLTQNLLNLHIGSLLDTAPLVRAAWEGITAPDPSREQAGERRAVFLQTASQAFAAERQGSERAAKDIWRPGYTAFIPLADVCALGAAARILDSWDPLEITELLSRVEHWSELPHAAVSHAVRLGVPFPLPGHPLRLEELDELAERTAQKMPGALELLERALEDGSVQSRSWARALALALVHRCEWKNKEEGLRLARRFAEAESAFLPMCYAPEVLTPEGMPLLPPMHRFGWYCAQAFGALDGGDAAGYARFLRQGLNCCEGAKPIVEFLLEHTPELQAAAAPPELLALAEQVRTMLAAYSPDDPAVAALKASPAYQEIAYLIEGGGT